jgi:hypothetical protein
VEKRRLRIEAERLAVEKVAKSSAEEQANEILFLRGVMIDMGADLAVMKIVRTKYATKIDWCGGRRLGE